VRPSARRSTSKIRSTRRTAAEGTSLAWAGDWPSASLEAYHAGCLTLHPPPPPPVRRRGHLSRLGRRLAFGKPGGVRRRMLDVPPPDSTNVAVGSWADAPPMMTAPVPQIVTTAGRRTYGPVAHLVH